VRGELLVLAGRRMLVAFELRAAARADTLTGVLRVLSVRRAFTAVRVQAPLKTISMSRCRGSFWFPGFNGRTHTESTESTENDSADSVDSV
jgi:hypothetical protein